MSNIADKYNIGGSAFWILFILLGLGGLLYLMVWSFHNDSVKGIALSIIFFAMIIAGVSLSRLKIFDEYSWGTNSLSFSLGFFAWLIIGNLFGKQSVLSLTENNLFATVSSELPQFVEMITTVFIIPIAEELFWMVGIPFALISIMTALGKQYPIWSNKILQMVVVIIISSGTFAIFHVGKVHTLFMISAIIFRTIMIVLIYGDEEFNILKGVNLVVAFSLGSHIANNMINFGVSKTWLILRQELLVTFLIVGLFLAIFLTAIDRILGFIMGKKSTLEDIGKK